MVSIDVYEYDKNENMIESIITFYDVEGNVTYTMATECDDQETNNKVIFKYYDEEGNITDKKLYEYDENENEIKSTTIEYDVDEDNVIDSIVDECN